MSKEIDYNNLPPRAELNLHTSMSYMGSVITPEEVACLAEKPEYSSIAITDYNIVQAFPDVYEKAKRKGVANKIIHGVRIACYHTEFATGYLIYLVLLVKNQTGLKNLYQIISSVDNDTKWCEMKFVSEHSKGLIIGFSDFIISKVDLFPELLHYDYVEICPDSTPFSNELISERLMYAREKNIPAVAVSNARYIKKEDAICLEVLMDGERNYDEEQNLYLRSTKMLLDEFSWLGEETAYKLVIENPNKIAAQIEQVTPIPESREFELLNAADELRWICNGSARLAYGDPLPQIVAERLDMELSFVLSHGFESHYMLFYDIVSFTCRGLYTSTRGAGSSFLVYLLGISEVNPLPPHYLCPSCQHSEFITEGVASGFDLPDKKCPECGAIMYSNGHNIPYETFMGYKGSRVPDFNISVTQKGKEVVLRYLKSKFGSDRVALAGAARYVGESEAESLIEQFEAHKGAIDCEERQLIKNRISGVHKSDDIHPCGVFIVPEGRDIYDYTPVRNCEEEGVIETVTHFNSYSLSGRLLQTNIYIHSALEALERLKKLTCFKAEHVDVNAPEIYELFNGTEVIGIKPRDIDGVEIGTLGLPVFKREYMRQPIYKVKPKCFSDLVKCYGLEHGTGVWKNNGEMLFESGIAALGDLAAFRDDVMLYLMEQGMEHEEAFSIF